MICETICLLFSNLLGATSSQSILLDTSTANTISIPSRFIVSDFVPIFGLTNPITKQAKATVKTTNLRPVLNPELSGLNFFIISKSPNSCCFFLFQYKLNRNTTTKIGMTNNKVKYFFSSNSYIYFS